MVRKKGESGSKKNLTKPPKINAEDVQYVLVKAGLASIPTLGAAVSELFSLITSPLEKRRDEWVVEIAKSLKELEEKVDDFKMSELSQNEVFITTVTYATQAAIRNHQEEKLEALKNAVLNAALPNSPSEDLQLMFLEFIDTLTPWHLRVLKFFSNPLEWAQKHNISYSFGFGGSPGQALLMAFPELNKLGEFSNLLVKDLSSRGLLLDFSLSTMMTGNGATSPRITAIGSQFLSFISSTF